ncbi:chromodomain Y-like protein 2 [Drosophila biarmipes]|uniref:chromodomain Y-like protein 2 n=1 Tax=Drosophila biarmipes TaxID=125945 RepID=UPI0007E6ADBB|nr:chromodomain Y-like protein 2 [Drosophila biarmipes]
MISADVDARPVFRQSDAVSLDCEAATMATHERSCKHFRELVVKERPGLLHIHFQRQWNRRTIYELMRALDLATADPGVQLVVLSGEFSAGCGGEKEPLALRQGQEKRMRQLASQLKAVSSDDAEEQYIPEKAANFVMRSMAKKLLGHRKLLVAFVEAQCVGLGLSVSSLCDLVFATPSASFEPAFSHLDPCTQVGPAWTVSHVNWLLRLGDRADASSAHHSGLVTSVVSDAQGFWHRMAQYSLLPTASLLATKSLLLRPWRESLLNELRAEGTPMAAQRRRLAKYKL